MGAFRRVWGDVPSHKARIHRMKETRLRASMAIIICTNHQVKDGVLSIFARSVECSMMGAYEVGDVGIGVCASSVIYEIALSRRPSWSTHRQEVTGCNKPFSSFSESLSGRGIKMNQGSSEYTTTWSMVVGRFFPTSCKETSYNVEWYDWVTNNATINNNPNQPYASTRHISQLR